MPLVGSEPVVRSGPVAPSAEQAWEAVSWGHGTLREPASGAFSLARKEQKRGKGGREGEEEEEDGSLESCPVCVGTQSCLCVCAP